MKASHFRLLDLLETQTPQILFGSANICNTATKRLEELRPSDGNKLNLAEAAMTVGKFDECRALAMGLDDGNLEGEYAMFRDLLIMSCEWGAGHHAAARGAVKALVKAAAEAKRNGWRTSGDRAYLKDAKEFAVGRAQWITLYLAVEDGDTKVITDAAQAIGKLAGQ